MSRCSSAGRTLWAPIRPSLRSLALEAASVFPGASLPGSGCSGVTDCGLASAFSGRRSSAILCRAPSFFLPGLDP